MNWIIAATVAVLVLLVVEEWWHRRTAVMPTIRRHPEPYDFTKEEAA